MAAVFESSPRGSAGSSMRQSRTPAAQQICHRHTTTNNDCLRRKFLLSQKLGTALRRYDGFLELFFKWRKTIFRQDVII
jgi:hypothetical protein